MTTGFARRLLASALSAALVLLSPGLEAPRVFAQTLRAAPVEGLSVPAAPASGAALAPAAPALGSALTLSAPAASLSAPALAAPTAATLPAAVSAAAPLAAAAADGVDAYGAGRGLEDVLTGARSATAGEAPAAVPAFAAVSAAPNLSAAAGGEAGRGEAAKAAADAPAPAPAPKGVDSAISYKIHRLLLQTVARLTGAVDSLPPAGPALTDELIQSAADRRAVISDFDDTLAAFNERLPADMVAAVQGVHAAGKTFDVISDRGDEKRGNSLTVFESLDTLPVETRAGMYVAANSGGRVYRYDETGTPVKVYEAPAMSDEVKAHIAAAAEATKARLSEAGTTQHDGVGKIPAESWGPYSYALMLKPGSSEASVKATAAILQAELDKKGVDVEVNPRFAKDPANPPYVTLSLITKEGAAHYISQARKAGPEDVVLLGDSMYVPRAPKKESWLTRLGERASGQPRPALGNRTDANMERGIPGALTLSVGANGDPRTENLYVLGGKGPSLTRRVLESVASRSADAPRRLTRRDAFMHLYGPLALVAAVAGFYALLIHAIGGYVAEMEDSLRQLMHETPTIFGAAGVLAYGFGPGHFVVNPATDYQEARNKAVALAAARGFGAAEVRFVQATASLPEQGGKHWHYQFEIPGKNGGKALVYVDSSRFLGGAPELRTSVFEGARAKDGQLTPALVPHLFAKGAQIDPQTALDAVRRAAPEFGARASVALDYREEPLSGDGDLWYRFYDDKGGAASVNARTSEVRVEAGASLAPSLSASISRVSPVEGFSSYVYDEALKTARDLAAKGGYSADNLRLEAAALSPRAWGEDWTFHFVAPRQDYSKGPRGYTVTVRRTMVAETQLDAIAARDEGPRRMFSAVPAAAVPELVKLTPMEAIAKTGPEARTLELQARWPKEGPAELWYVVRGDKGRELMAVHAGTGAVERPEPYAALKSALATAGLIGLVAVIYASLSYAITHAPADSGSLQLPEGWQGGVPSNGGIGGFFGAGLIAGVLGRGKAPSPKPTDADVRARASAVSSYKGYPWSETEYNSAYYPALENLKKEGATAEQIALFVRLCAEAELRGGRFNPWSGD